MSLLPLITLSSCGELKTKNRMKKQKQNAGPYQAAVQAFLTARLHGTWDAIKYADQDGATNEYGVAKNEGFLEISSVEDLMDNYRIVEGAGFIGQLAMAKCTTGCSDAQLKRICPGHNAISYDIVNTVLAPYLPFFQACAQVLEKHMKITGAELKQIFEDMGLSL